MGQLVRGAYLEVEIPIPSTSLRAGSSREERGLRMGHPTLDENRHC
jgi:hypothetical protein